MADNSTVIAELDEVIRAGASFVGVDGQQIRTELDVLQKERRDLMAGDQIRRGDRPRVCRIDLSQGP